MANKAPKAPKFFAPCPTAAPPFAATKNGIDSEPVCSPDGKWLVFRRQDDGDGELWRASMDGGEPTRLNIKGARFPAFSHDGKWIAAGQRPAI